MLRRGTEEVVTGSTRNRVTPQKGVRGFESHPLRQPLLFLFVCNSLGPMSLSWCPRFPEKGHQAWQPKGESGSEKPATSAKVACGASPCTSQRSPGNLDSQREQFAVQPRGSPEHVRSAHVADQLSNLLHRPRSPNAPTTALPLPVEPDPVRCQPMTVSGLTITRDLRHFGHRR